MTDADRTNDQAEPAAGGAEPGPGAEALSGGADGAAPPGGAGGGDGRSAPDAAAEGLPDSDPGGMGDQRLTERRNPASRAIDRLPPREIVELINAEDRRVAEAVGEEGEAIARAMELAVEAVRAGGRLIYVGAGTSGRLGVLDAAEMPPTFGTDPEMVQGIIAGGFGALVRAKEGAEDHPEDGAAAIDEKEVDGRDFVLGIATSGTTPFVHGALGRARERGARTGFLLRTPPSDALRAKHDVVIAPLVGPEVITGSTRMKAGTATKLVLNTITTGAMVRLGKVYGNLMVDLQVTCRKLQDRGERILAGTLGLRREEARELLGRAGGHVKSALVMHLRGVERDEALRLLQEADGVVAAVAPELAERGAAAGARDEAAGRAADGAPADGERA